MGHMTPLLIPQAGVFQSVFTFVPKGWLPRQSFPGSSKAVIFLLLALAIVSPPRAGAVGMRLPNQDPEAIARGNAFVATADNPSAIYYNPAGITQLEGSQVRVGMYFISASTEYTSLTGARAQTDDSFQAVPQLYCVYSLENTGFSFGLGVYAPYGLAMDWGNSPPFNAIAREGKLLYATLSPVMAWRVLPSLSLAVGPTINYTDAKFNNASFNFHGDDTGFGLKAGLLWQPHRQWSFGASYQSATDMTLHGHSEVPAFFLGDSPTRAKAHFPQFMAVGVSFRPTDKWNFEFDVDWTDWDSLDQVSFQRADTIIVPFAFFYQSSFMYEFGITRQLGQGYFVSTGYIYSENSSPDANYNPIVPDANLHLGSIGFGHRGKRWDWAVGYHFGYNGRRDVQGGSPLANGSYETLNHAFNLSTTYKF